MPILRLVRHRGQQAANALGWHDRIGKLGANAFDERTCPRRRREAAGERALDLIQDLVAPMRPVQFGLKRTQQRVSQGGGNKDAGIEDGDQRRERHECAGATLASYNPYSSLSAVSSSRARSRRA